MGIQVDEKDGAVVLRLVSKSVTGSDITAARNAIEKRIPEGSSIFILSMEQSHKGSFVACGLIAICAEVVHGNGGTLMLDVRSGKYDEETRELCKSLNIFTYNDDTTAIFESAQLPCLSTSG
jgi:hypothetical protein